MKTKLLSLFLVLTFTCSAQTVKFITDNLNDVRQTADSIALNAKRTYRFSSEGKIKDSYIYRIRYVNVSDTTDILPVFFHISMKGSNAALEISGTPEYFFHTTFGKFLDLFPFWKKFIQPESDKVAASKQMNEATINGKRFYLRESPGHDWEISMH